MNLFHLREILPKRLDNHPEKLEPDMTPAMLLGLAPKTSPTLAT